MKRSNITYTKNGIVAGNVTDKKNIKNPIGKYLVKKFEDRIISILRNLKPSSITEVGCGEGDLIKLFLDNTKATITALELSNTVLDKARNRIQNPRVWFEQMDIYDIPDDDKYKSDLIVCCEVLEHLNNPEVGLKKLYSISESYCLISVPREPIWRFLNLLRLSYVCDLGNTPGHLQHWGAKDFISFVSKYFKVEEKFAPIPWTILLCRKK